MRFRLLLLLIIIFLFKCTKKPDIIPEEVVDLSYSELNEKYNSCVGKGIMSSKGQLPWKLNYTFTTQNDSSYIQFRDIFGRRILFVQALPNEVKLWDMQKNLQFNSKNGNSIPVFDIVESFDIAQILWGEIPKRYSENSGESISEKDSNLVNFDLSVTKLGMVLDKVTFNIDLLDTVIEFKIFQRDYGESNRNLLKGIPEHIPYN